MTLGVSLTLLGRRQVEHILGAIALAKALRRCLVLPDVSDIHATISSKKWIPFETLFDAEHFGASLVFWSSA